MADRVLLQMDQAEPGNQIIHWCQQKCAAHSNLNCDVCLSDSGFHQFLVETGQRHAANFEVITDQSVRKVGFTGFTLG